MRHRRKWWLWVVAVVVIGGAAGGYYYYHQQQQSAAADASAAPLQTATVRRGNIELSATGAGTLIPAGDDVSVGFKISGTLAVLMVQEGDTVSAGDPLARLDDTDAKNAVTTAQQGVTEAQHALDVANYNLQSAQDSAQSGVSNAYTSLGNAQDNLATAQANLADPNNVDSMIQPSINLQRAQQAVQQAQNVYDTYQTDSWIHTCQESRNCDVNTWQTSAQEALTKAQQDLQIAQASYDQAYASLQSAVDSAQNSVDNAYVSIANSEPNPDNPNSSINSAKWTVTQAQISLQNAQMTLDSAQAALEDLTLLAPVDGIVSSISASVGDEVSSSFITLSSSKQPVLQFYIDEADLSKLAIGYEVDVVFDAFPDATFVGHVYDISNSLAQVGGTNAVEAWASFDPGAFSDYSLFPTGMSATVDVIAGRADNALLVPIEALHELSPGSYAVFVMKNGTPTLTVVQVGLEDDVYAQILSGVQQGDVVSTGIVETQQ